MHYRISFIFVTFICLFGFVLAGRAQDANTDESSKPVILYSGTPKKYEIADIKVEGVKNYEDYVLIGLSGLSVGQTISVPGILIPSRFQLLPFPSAATASSCHTPPRGSSRTV